MAFAPFVFEKGKQRLELYINNEGYLLKQSDQSFVGKYDKEKKKILLVEAPDYLAGQVVE